MSSTIDPAKLKVVDLRSELTARGLDSKGNKAALVKRLKDALEKELKQDLPDTSIADTSTEELDTSQTDEKVHELPKKENDRPPTEEKMETDEPKPNRTIEKPKTSRESKLIEKPKVDLKSSEKQKSIETAHTAESSGKPEVASDPSERTKSTKSEIQLSASSKDDDVEQKTEENGEHLEQGEEKSQKTRWSEDNKPSEEVDNQETESKDQERQPGTSKSESETDQKGEKRRRTSPSPDRSQRRRSRSPVKEDEPTIDNEKVQLSWYDSDLHLQLDKESFLSAKPLTEGAFGYAWAGVRGTHGVSSGKVCYEVKLLEELKWEDFSKYHEQRVGRDRYKTDHRKNQKRDKDKKDSDKKSDETSKTEDSENKNNKPTDKDDKTTGDQEKSEDKDEKQESEGIVEKMDETTVEEMAEEPEKTEKKPVETDELVGGDDKPTETDILTDNKKSEDTESEIKPKDEKVEVEDNKKEVTSEAIPTHLFRVGWSLITSNLQLGEGKYSYGYESSGRFVTDRQFVEYGIKFGVEDVIGAYLDINSENVTIRYTVNGQIQPVATTIPKSDFPEENFALFPHVLSRNYAFEFNLGNREEPWFPIPAELEGYLYLSKVENKIAGPTRPENRGECEVILMCGLPASGKTHWVKEHVSSNLEKRYTVLGNTNLLDKMTVSGEPLKSRFKGRWSMLVDKLQKCLNKLISIAALRRRNYIIDQTNVFPSAQRRKMRPFEGFKRRAVIVVVGDEEQARRQSLQEAQDGKDVPDSTILEMKAAMSLPEKGEWIEEVTYVGVEEVEAKEIVKKYNAAGKEAGYGLEKRFGRRDDRWQNRRNDYRGKNYRERSYHSQRYDPRGPRQGGWNNQRPSGGNWNRDRRDSRGPPGRDWRGSGRDHGNRVNRGQSSNYNRSRPGGGRGSWSGGSWGNQGWNQQTFGSGAGAYGGGQQGWGGQWKYNQGSGGGQGYGNYQNWNYYGQYAQNWNNQGPQPHSTMGTGAGNGAVNSQYDQGYNTQEAWAQYARQYAQQSTAAQNQAASVAKSK